ncbi:MAG TPA: DMT family transporter [Bacillus sp. (in: firmicutes)]|uniref:DMT family transporter n=1 Tax=Bacillus litorisediminis TaxID=2922713 RepID=UPI001FAD4605|nr:DMT family transporter [Bacillus litorisediminis]HWO74510.1 DMT family transporter [Bacillus sp. (in: firmicutes)]
MKKPHIYLMLTGVMMLWGFNVSILKTLVENVSPVTMTSLRIFSASICVLLIMYFLHIFRKPTKKEWKYIIGGSLLNVVGHHYFLSIGLTETSATNGALVLGMGPLLTAIMTLIFLRQKPSFIRLSGFILGSIGVSITVLSGSEGLAGLSIGDIHVFLSIFVQAGSFIMISKAAKSIDPRLLTGYMLLFGSILLFIIGIWSEPSGLSEFFNMPWELWFLFFISAIFGTAVGHMLYNYAIGQTGPAEAAIFINLNTFFALLGTSLFLHEKITSSHLIGLVFIITGVIMGSGALEEMKNKTKWKKNVPLAK